MEAADVVDLVTVLEEHGVAHWLDGGCVLVPAGAVRHDGRSRAPSGAPGRGDPLTDHLLTAAPPPVAPRSVGRRRTWPLVQVLVVGLTAALVAGPLVGLTLGTLVIGWPVTVVLPAVVVLGVDALGAATHQGSPLTRHPAPRLPWSVLVVGGTAVTCGVLYGTLRDLDLDLDPAAAPLLGTALVGAVSGAVAAVLTLGFPDAAGGEPAEFAVWATPHPPFECVDPVDPATLDPGVDQSLLVRCVPEGPSGWYLSWWDGHERVAALDGVWVHARARPVTDRETLHAAVTHARRVPAGRLLEVLPPVQVGP